MIVNGREIINYIIATYLWVEMEAVLATHVVNMHSSIKSMEQLAKGNAEISSNSQSMNFKLDL